MILIRFSYNFTIALTQLIDYEGSGFLPRLGIFISLPLGIDAKRESQMVVVFTATGDRPVLGWKV